MYGTHCIILLTHARQELSAFSSKTSKSLKELQIKCEKLQHDCQEQSILRNKAERRLKEVEWLRLEEVKKNSARKKKAPAAAAPRKKKAGAKSESESMVLMILKQENEQLKRDLSKAQKVGGKKEKEKERDKEKGKEKVMPPPSSAPPEAETAAAPALAHKQAKEALKAADRDKKRVKEEVRKKSTKDRLGARYSRASRARRPAQNAPFASLRRKTSPERAIQERAVQRDRPRTLLSPAPACFGPA